MLGFLGSLIGGIINTLVIVIILIPTNADALLCIPKQADNGMIVNVCF